MKNLLLFIILPTFAQAQISDLGAMRKNRFRIQGAPVNEGPIGNNENTQEAPTGFDNETNGFDPQGPPFEQIDEDNVKALRSFNDNRFIFEEVETTGDGLGPT